MNWFLLALKKTFNFRDRARRKEYGWFSLSTFLISFALTFLGGMAPALGLVGVASTLLLANKIFIFAMFVPSLSITTRRLHDLGHSGWWQLLPIVLVSVPNLVAALLAGNPNTPLEGPHLWCVVIGSIVWVILLLYLLFAEGERDTNKYGPDPKSQNLPDDKWQTDKVDKQAF